MSALHEFPRGLRLAAVAICIAATAASGGANGSQVNALEEVIGGVQEDLEACRHVRNCSKDEVAELEEMLDELLDLKRNSREDQ